MSYAGLDAGILYKSDPFNGILGSFFQKSQGRRSLPKKSRSVAQMFFFNLPLG